MDNNRKALTEALLRRNGFDEAAQKTAQDYLERLQRAVYPMEPWEAPFVIAAAQRLIDTLQRAVPGCQEAAEGAYNLLCPENLIPDFDEEPDNLVEYIIPDENPPSN